MRITTMAVVIAAALSVLACSSGERSGQRRLDQATAGGTDGTPADLAGGATSFYREYERRLRVAPGPEVARLYHVRGAHIVIDGASQRFSRAQLDSVYGPGWRRPTYFAWDSLALEPLPPDRALAFGRFRWQDAGARDTATYLYVGLVEAVDSGFAIRFEHETLVPPRPQQ